MNKRKTPSAFRLSDRAKALLEALADKHGVNQTAVIEMAIREKAERDKVEPKVEPDVMPKAVPLRSIIIKDKESDDKA